MKYILFAFLLSLVFFVKGQSGPQHPFDKYREIPNDTLISHIINLKSIDEVNKIKPFVDSLAEYYLEKKDTVAYAFIRNEFAFNYYVLGEKKYYLTQLEDIFEKVKESPKTHLERTVNLYYQTFYYSSQNFEKFIELNKQIIERTSLEKHPYIHMAAYGNLGKIYLRKQQFSDAFHYFNKKEELSLKFDDTTAVGFTYQTIGYEILPVDPNLGILYLDKSHKILKGNTETSHEIQYIYYLASKARAYTMLDDYDKAIETLKLKEDYINRIKDSVQVNLTSILETYRSFSGAYAKTEAFDQAKTYAHLFIDTVQRYVGNDHPFYSMALRKLGEVYLSEPVPDSAVYYFQKALNIRLDSNSWNHNRNNFLYFFRLGEGQLAQNDYNAAAKSLKNALACIVAPTYEQDTFYLNYPHVSEISKKKDYQIALNQYNNALLGIYYETEETKYLSELIKNNKYNLAIQSARYSFSIDEETALTFSNYAKNDCFFGLMASMHFAYNHQQKNYLDTALFFLSQTKLFHFRNLLAQKQLFNQSADSTIMELNHLQDQMLTLENQQETITNYDDSLFDIKNKAFLLKMQLETDINKELVDQPFSYDLIAETKNIDQDKAYISFTHIQDSLFIMGISSEKKILYQGNFMHLKELTKGFLRDIKTGNISSKYANELYKRLITPVQEVLVNKKQLVIIPDDVLFEIPFELLQNGDGDQIVENFSVQYQYNLSFNEKAYEHERGLVAIAPFSENDSELNPLMANRFRSFSDVLVEKNGEAYLPQLPATRSEVKEIALMFNKENKKVQTIIGSEANKQEVLNYFNQFDIVHIATHGIETNRLYSSGFLLYSGEDAITDDNSIMLYELQKQNISANLAVLSACKTGTGQYIEGEGIMALPRGFIYAGVPNVIASLWKVHDEKTKDLMVAFYKHLLEDNVSYAEALRLAKRDCIKKGFLPLDWAGFILVGS